MDHCGPRSGLRSEYVLPRTDDNEEEVNMSGKGKKSVKGGLGGGHHKTEGFRIKFSS